MSHNVFFSWYRCRIWRCLWLLQVERRQILLRVRVASLQRFRNWRIHTSGLTDRPQHPGDVCLLLQFCRTNTGIIHSDLKSTGNWQKDNLKCLIFVNHRNYAKKIKTVYMYTTFLHSLYVQPKIYYKWHYQQFTKFNSLEDKKKTSLNFIFVKIMQCICWKRYKFKYRLI